MVQCKRINLSHRILLGRNWLSHPIQFSLPQNTRAKSAVSSSVHVKLASLSAFVTFSLFQRHFFFKE